MKDTALLRLAKADTSGPDNGPLIGFDLFPESPFFKDKIENVNIVWTIIPVPFVKVAGVEIIS